MRLFCDSCKVEINVSRPSPQGFVCCWQCHEKIALPVKKAKHLTSVDIHPQLARKYGVEQNNPRDFQKKISLGSDAKSADKPEEIPIIPQYEILKVIGKGAMGTVYRAHHLTSKRDAAVKILSAQLVERADLVARFERESAVLRAFRHPNVVSILDSGQSGIVHYYCMEFVKGKTLRKRFRHEQLSISQSINIVKDILRGLSAAHAKGIIHRDLKPENVMIEKGTGRIVLLDFGLAGVLSADNDLAQNLTHSRVSMGTVNYMAPEQHTDAKRVDHRTDLYACGVILYECLTGELPLGRYLLPTEKGIGVPKSLDDLLLATLARDPKNRIDSAQEFLSSLKRIEEELEEVEKSKINTQPMPIENNQDCHESDSELENLPTRILTQIPQLQVVRYMSKAPKLVWSFAVLFVGIVFGLVWSSQSPSEVMISKNLVEPVYLISKLELNKTAWLSYSPAWESLKTNLVNYIGEQEDKNYFRKDLGLLISKENNNSLDFTASVLLKKYKNSIKSTKQLHQTRELLGGLPNSKSGGVLILSADEENAVAMLRFDNNQCGLAVLSRYKNKLEIIKTKKTDCQSSFSKPVELGLSCSEEESKCTGLINGKKNSSLSLEFNYLENSKKAFGCQNVDCHFKI